MRAADHPLQYMLFPPYRDGCACDPDWLGPWLEAAERLGFHGVLFPEHTLVFADYEPRYPYATDGVAPMDPDTEMPDPLETLAFAAARTSRIRLGTAVLVLPNHHPAMLAKRLATVDRLSRGRLEISVGVGWMKEEVESFGVPYAKRGRYVDETIDVLRALWAGQMPRGADLEGEFHQLRGALSYPTPVRGQVPIHIGGHSDVAIRRAARRGDGFHPLGIDDDALPDALALLRSEALASGRDPDAIALTHGLAPIEFPDLVDDAVESANRFGADRVQLVITNPQLDEAVQAMEACAARFGLGQTSTYAGA